ncbi:MULTISPECIES: TPM domain-containing protein [Gracilibacillus]|uniref:TPM domain-containing protein n=1 Tax=Gracilibacillus TaxID=74385 RepID=UPI000825966F|nr:MULTISPECIES: TPM domain-containing protein [Gracilibacillus]
MRKYLAALCFIVLVSLLWLPASFAVEQYIYDDGNLLNDGEREELTQLAEEYSANHDVNLLIATATDLGGRDVVQYTEDFYDEHDTEFGDAAILTIDMSENREVYLAGFGKGEQYLEDSRLDQIREQITPYLSNENFFAAGELYLEKADQYLGVNPIINPESILLKTWFQLVVAVVIGGAIVGFMIFNMGGRVTVDHQTYVDANNSKVKRKKDTYVRKTVSKTKIQKNSGGGRGGGGGGVTSGGHSHSGSRGGF